MFEAALLILLLADAPANSPEQKPVAELLTDPRPDSLVSVPGVKLSLESSSKDQRATASGGVSLLEDKLYAQLKISGPLGGEGETKVADLSGLRSGGLAELSLTSVFWNEIRDDKAQEAVCRKYTGKPFCKTGDLDTQEKKDELKAAVRWGVPLEVGIVGAVGYRSYSYLDPDTLEATPTDLLSGSAGLRGGAYFRGVGKFSLQVSWERTVTDSQSTTICLPVGTMGATRCDKAFLGAPTLGNTALVKLEYRRWLNGFLGVNPVLEYDLRANVFSIRGILYALQDKEKGGLNGGISLGWRSDASDRLDLTVFIGELFAVPAGK